MLITQKEQALLPAPLSKLLFVKLKLKAPFHKEDKYRSRDFLYSPAPFFLTRKR